MTKPKITITELSEFEPTRVDGVGKGANGFPILMLKGVEEESTDVVTDVLAAVQQIEAAKAADRADCETCDGTGKIMMGNRKCPDCQATGKKAMIGDTVDTLASKAGVAPSGSGATPATDCPTCKGDGILRNGTHDGKQCPDCGGTGRDEARTNPKELRAMNADAGRISVGDPDGRETIDKAAGAYVAPNPTIAASTQMTTSGTVPGDGSSDASPGSPAWEAIDAATATAAASSLMQASEFIRTFAQRERMEVAAGEGNDVFDAGAAEAAIAAVSQALGIMAQLAFHESQEAQKSEFSKAGKRLAGKTIAALAAARDHLNIVLGSDDPALAASDGDETDATDKFIASANKALNSERNVLNMTEEELQRLVVSTVAQAVVTADAVKGKAYDDNVDGIAGGKNANKKSKKKNPKVENFDLEDEADHGDNDSGSMDAAKAELTP